MFWLSFIHPHVSGFARVVAWQIAKQVDGDVKRQNDETSTTHLVRQKDERFRRYCEMFQGNENFSIDKSHFTKMLRNLRLKFRDWNPRLIEQRHHYVQVFAVENWTELTKEIQSDHNLEGCGASIRGVQTPVFQLRLRLRLRLLYSSGYFTAPISGSGSVG